MKSSLRYAISLHFKRFPHVHVFSHSYVDVYVFIGFTSISTKSNVLRNIQENVIWNWRWKWSSRVCLPNRNEVRREYSLVPQFIITIMYWYLLKLKTKNKSIKQLQRKINLLLFYHTYTHTHARAVSKKFSWKFEVNWKIFTCASEYLKFLNGKYVCRKVQSCLPSWCLPQSYVSIETY